MNLTTSLFGLAGLGDLPWAYWLLVPMYVVGPFSVMTAVQGGGLLLLSCITFWPMFRRQVNWRPRRLLVFCAYPVFVFITNVAGIANSL